MVRAARSINSCRATLPSTRDGRSEYAAISDRFALESSLSTAGAFLLHTAIFLGACQTNSVAPIQYGATWTQGSAQEKRTRSPRGHWQVQGLRGCSPRNQDGTKAARPHQTLGKKTLVGGRASEHCQTLLRQSWAPLERTRGGAPARFNNAFT